MKVVRMFSAPFIFGLDNVQHHKEQTAVFSLLVVAFLLLSLLFPPLLIVSAPLYLLWGFALVYFGAVTGTSTRDAISFTQTVPPLKLKKPLKDMKLYVFQTGKIESGSWGVYEGPSHPIVMDQLAFLISHPKHGLVLFEAGINPGVATNPVGYVGKFLYYAGFLKMQQKPKQDLYAQLIAQGFNPSDIKTIYVSHLHPEHGGGVSLFKKAQIAVDRREYEYAMGRPKYNYFKKEYKDVKKWELLDFENTQDLPPFEGAIDIFGDQSIYIVSTPGHTPGSTSMLINLPEGPVFLVGDIAWRLENIETRTIGMPFVSVNGYAHRVILGKLIAFIKKNPHVLIVPSHDVRMIQMEKREDIRLI